MTGVITFVTSMNKELLKYCLQRIEQKLNWASSDQWQNQDFELLSKRIFEATGVQLSITTLKRVWGKVNYVSEPSISTLNALAKFIDYENWSELKNGNQSKTLFKKDEKRSLPLKPLVMAGTLLLLIAAIVGFSQRQGAVDLTQVKFGAEPVTLGLPNTVVFTYDFGSNDIEEASIQQSWNQKLTFGIDPKKKAATGIYYYPGYFRAKLLANKQILVEQDLHIRTDGWMATINRDEIPRYLYDGELNINGKIGLTNELLEELHAMNDAEASLLTFHFFDDFQSIASDEFVFETRFRNTYQKSNGICQQVQVLVHCESGVFLTPFSIPGCSSELDLITSGKTFSGKENDLTPFGINTEEWNLLRLEVSKGIAQYFVNDILIFSQAYEDNIGKIVGFKFRFEGAGEIDFVKLSNTEQTILHEDFTAENQQ